MTKRWIVESHPAMEGWRPPLQSWTAWRHQQLHTPAGWGRGGSDWACPSQRGSAGAVPGTDPILLERGAGAADTEKWRREEIKKNMENECLSLSQRRFVPPPFLHQWSVFTLVYALSHQLVFTTVKYCWSSFVPYRCELKCQCEQTLS